MESVTDTDILHYEGLVRKTASMYVDMVEEEYDDLCQLLRVKAWKALLSFDPAKSTQGQDKYVFSCLRNQVKDFLKKKKHNVLFIEDIAPLRGDRTDTQDFNARDAFEHRYLESSEEDAFATVEDELPNLPSTLTGTERNVALLLYLDFDYGEIGAELLVSRKEVGTTVKGIREKMADWKPTPGSVVPPPRPRQETPLAA